MVDDLEIRRRRALWRARHRGTKELDLLIGGYAERHLATMSEPELGRFEFFLKAQDPILQSALLSTTPAGDIDAALQEIVDAIRDFHGLAIRPSRPRPGSAKEAGPVAEDTKW